MSTSSLKREDARIVADILAAYPGWDQESADRMVAGIQHDDRLPLALALLAILAVVALRHREPDRAVMRPWREDDADAQIGRAMVERAKWLVEHGDPHEARHYLAALKAGDSTFCDGGRDCRLDREAWQGYARQWDADADLQPSDPYPASLLP